jgi:hypothetical protein
MQPSQPNLFESLFAFHPREDHTPKENFHTESFAYLLRTDNEVRNCWLSLLLGKRTLQPSAPSYSWVTNAGDAMLTFIKLKWLELKLTGEFGQHTKYRRLCVERNATTTAEKLLIAQEVILGGATGVVECWAHSIYLKKHEKGNA